jgi:hypothetical protein
VLNRAAWSCLALSRILIPLLLATFVAPDAPVIVGLGETIERRWLPNRILVVVADSTYAAFNLLAHCAQVRNPVPLITHLRLDAALYDPAPARTATTVGRPRTKGARQPTLAWFLAGPATAWETTTRAHPPGADHRSRQKSVRTTSVIKYQSPDDRAADRGVTHKICRRRYNSRQRSDWVGFAATARKR